MVASMSIAEQSPPNGDGGRVLVVDDDPVQQQSQGEILRLSGFEVRVVGDGARALDLLDSGISTWCCSTGGCPG